MTILLVRSLFGVFVGSVAPVLETVFVVSGNICMESDLKFGSYQVSINGLQYSSHDLFKNCLTNNQKQVGRFAGFSHELLSEFLSGYQAWLPWAWMDFEDGQFQQAYAKVNEFIRRNSASVHSRIFIPSVDNTAERAAASTVAAILHGTGRGFFTESLLAGAAFALRGNELSDGDARRRASTQTLPRAQWAPGPVFRGLRRRFAGHRPSPPRPTPEMVKEQHDLYTLRNLCWSRIKLLPEDWDEPCKAADKLFRVAHIWAHNKHVYVI